MTHHLNKNFHSEKSDQASLTLIEQVQSDITSWFILYDVGSLLSHNTLSHNNSIVLLQTLIMSIDPEDSVYVMS